MRAPPPVADDEKRIEALESYGSLDESAGKGIAALVRVASILCEVPIAFVSLVGRDFQHFVSPIGLSGLERTPRDVAFCAHAIAGTGLMEVEDAATDERFSDNPLVTGEPRIRFYAAIPLIEQEGFALGTLCVIDRTPRMLSLAQREALGDLARGVVELIAARRVAIERTEATIRAEGLAADLEVVLNSVPVGVGYTSSDRRNRFANKAYAARYGRTSEELLCMHVSDLVTQDDAALDEPQVAAALRGEPQRFERRVLDTREGWRDLAVTYTPDRRAGEVRGFIETFSDVTVLRQALRQSEQHIAYLRMAEDVGQIGHWRLDVETQHIYWSPQVYRIHGLDPSTFQPELANAIDAYHPDDRAGVSGCVQEAIEKGSPFDFELRLIRPDGSIRRVHSKGRCEVDPLTQKTRSVFGVFHDITEREALRERIEHQERLVTTGILAAGVGHEINNPLTYVAANIELAAEELRAIAGASPSGRMREIIEMLHEARDGAERIRRIVRGLRNFARQDSISAPTDVNAAIEVSVNMAMHELRQRANLFTELGTVAPVFADEARLSQVFVNLIVNAAHSFKTSDPSKNRVLIRTFAGSDDRVHIEVTDNGSGIPPEVLPRIFDPFFTTKPVGSGTGLGLSICHNVVTSLSGDITCSTRLGIGTTFSVVLPPAIELPLAEARHVSSIPAAPRGRVMIVDDDEAVLKSLARVLGGQHDVVAVSDPREACRMLVDEGDSFDVVLCDMAMPHLNGMELYSRIASTAPGLADRFVFISGGSSNEQIQVFLAEVPNERMEKPVGNQNLRAVVRRFVGRAGLPTAKR